MHEELEIKLKFFWTFFWKLDTFWILSDSTLLVLTRDLESSPVKKDMNDVECFKCHKKGHYADKCPEIKAKDAKEAFKVRQVDDSEREDPFIRYWFILSDLGQLRIGPHNEGHLAKIFVDTGANCNTISRKFYSTLLDQGLKCSLIQGPLKVYRSIWSVGRL